MIPGARQLPKLRPHDGQRGSFSDVGARHHGQGRSTVDRSITKRVSTGSVDPRRSIALHLVRSAIDLLTTTLAA